MDHKDLIKQLESLAAIEDPVRRKLYLYVVSQAEEVTRDAAARAYTGSVPRLDPQ